MAKTISPAKNLTIELSSPGQSGWGFELMALNANRPMGGRWYFEHKSAGTELGTADLTILIGNLSFPRFLLQRFAYTEIILIAYPNEQAPPSQHR